MKKFLTYLATTLCVIFLTIMAIGFWFNHQTSKPGPFAQDQQFLVPPGTGGYGVTQKLTDEHLIAQPKLFYGLLHMHPGMIKAGEYALPAHSSLENIIAILHSGQTIKRNFTLAEGLTVKQATQLLQDNPYLSGEMPKEIAEGSLLPETYNFIRGDTRASIIKRMQEAQSKTLAELWQKRDPTVVLASPQQAVVLASIVEKETGIASERAKIAGLFYNRLKLGMPLQSDPTVVYVITDHLGHMGGKPLLSKDLQVNSPYNTYKVLGLPPGPIANPGRASLTSVLHPETHDYFYFVANGTGGHVFSKNLQEHNNNVKKWRQIKRDLQ
jgi:UPF0755 protein